MTVYTFVWQVVVVVDWDMVVGSRVHMYQMLVSYFLDCGFILVLHIHLHHALQDLKSDDIVL
jgi:hypothetical protein